MEPRSASYADLHTSDEYVYVRPCGVAFILARSDDNHTACVSYLDNFLCVDNPDLNAASELLYSSGEEKCNVKQKSAHQTLPQRMTCLMIDTIDNRPECPVMLFIVVMQ